MKVHSWIGKSRIAGKGVSRRAGHPKKRRSLPAILVLKISKEQRTRIGARECLYLPSTTADIDGNTLKNQARYINHSCDPNCVLHVPFRAIWVVAVRDIQAGEELTHQYNYEYGS